MASLTYDVFGDEAQIWSDEHGWRMLARDAIGRIRTITDADGVTTFDYDQGAENAGPLVNGRLLVTSTEPRL